VSWQRERNGRVGGIESNTFASEAGECGSCGADAIGAKGVERDEENVPALCFPAGRQKKQSEEASGTAENHGAILHDRRWLIRWDTNDSDQKSDLLKAVALDAGPMLALSS
jgi:hypothetical protein